MNRRRKRLSRNTRDLQGLYVCKLQERCDTCVFPGHCSVCHIEDGDTLESAAKFWRKMDFRLYSAPINGFIGGKVFCLECGKNGSWMPEAYSGNPVLVCDCKKDVFICNRKTRNVELR